MTSAIDITGLFKYTYCCLIKIFIEELLLIMRMYSHVNVFSTKSVLESI